MPEPISNNKRIAKNTLMLYIRMFFTMVVSLYTSRVIINTLGVTDYGIYGVVGGVITMFTFMNGAMSSATQRYINFCIGKNDSEGLATVFRTALQIHIFISFIVFLLGETIGLWFVNTQLVIPQERIEAALWVYHISVVTCMLGIICLPFNAEIIAHERMSAFAYISIIDVTLKLLIVYALVVTSFDKLILYAFLFLLVTLVDQMIYVVYCKRNFPEINFLSKFDKFLWKEMSSFAGWSLWGNLSGLLFTQGINILLNIFFGPTVNAARSIVVKVQGVIQGFVTNVQLAMNPQITKSYAVGDFNRMHTLMFASSKFCFYLLFLVVLPLTIEADIVLTTWLRLVPEHTVSFIRLIMAVMLTETLANPYIIANQATGKVKAYQAVCGGFLLTIVPIAYLVLKLGGSPESVFIVHFCIAILTQFARVFMMRKLIDLPIMTYFHKVLVPVLSVSILAPILPLLIYFNTDVNAGTVLLICLCSITSTLGAVSLVGLDKHERQLILAKSKSMIIKRLDR